MHLKCIMVWFIKSHRSKYIILNSIKNILIFLCFNIPWYFQLKTIIWTFFFYFQIKNLWVTKLLCTIHCFQYLIFMHNLKIWFISYLIQYLALFCLDAAWRCPHCQNEVVGKPSYVCFCGALPNPFSNSVDTPHSCGQVCGLVKRNGNAQYSDCHHKCTLLCHPGPCPQCVVQVLRFVILQILILLFFHWNFFLSYLFNQTFPENVAVEKLKFMLNVVNQTQLCVKMYVLKN